jgi:hypothetical protein
VYDEWRIVARASPKHLSSSEVDKSCTARISSEFGCDVARDRSATNKEIVEHGAVVVVAVLEGN